MKKSTFLLTSLLLGVGSLAANAQDFPTPTIHNPIMGISMFSTVTVVWDFQDLKEGPAENRMLTITTPSGETFVNRAFTEYTVENDQGGSMNETNPDGENSLTVSYYNKLIEAGYEIAMFTEKGVYTLHIPEGAVYINDQPNPEVDLTYNLGYIAMMEEGECEMVDNDGNLSLVLSWNGQEIKTTRAGANGMGGSLVNYDKDTESELFSGSFAFNEENTALVVTIGRLADGNYALVFPGNQVQNLEGAINPEQTYPFTVGEAGVESIPVSEDGIYKVYNLQGVKVAEGTADVLRSLDKGLYIINGVKVVK